MHGNVYEWCWDRYGSYSSESQTDPRGPASGNNRVIHGGSYSAISALYSRSAYRYSSTLSNVRNDFGFRIARGKL
jgi:formylglycine-generating enzyme required for sulfatase activity